jgi:multimeric flavodoxin WrbA
MQKVKLLGISGSPRKQGNTKYLLERALESAAAAGQGNVEPELYEITGKKFAPCISCYKCIEKGDCIQKDDFHELRDKWVDADAIIYSLPVYHMGIPGQVKCFIDRLGSSTYCKFGGLFKTLKPVGVVTQGAHIFAGQEQVMTAVINHAMIMGCVPVPGDPWQSYIGAGGWTRGDLEKSTISRLYEEQEVDAVAAVAAAESLGKRVAQMAIVLKTGGAACRNMLEADGMYKAFLSRLDATT